nr:NAAT family transporter [Bacilli bacterium]
MAAYFIHAVVSLFAVMNPLGIMPYFLAITANRTHENQRLMARNAVIAAFIILTIFLLIGNYILSLFSITIDAFRVAGGILIFGIAYDLLHAKSSSIQSPEGENVEFEDIALTPLAMPIIAGPGTITTVLALSAGPNRLSSMLDVFLAYVLVLIITFVIFYYAAEINKRLTQTQLNVITRLMGFILSIIAVQMAATGLGGLFPMLLHV